MYVTCYIVFAGNILKDITVFNNLIYCLVSERRHSNNTDEIDRALLEALNTNIQPSPIDGFMLRLAEGMRRLPYKDRSKLELEFLMKLRETEERLELLNN